jgi:hypothetical protein
MNAGAYSVPVIPGRAQREPGISRYNFEIPGLVLRTIPE